MSDLAVYAEAERIVAKLNDEQCDAVMAALERRADRWELDHGGRSSAVATATPPTLPARRPVGPVEAFFGVECCDAEVRRFLAYWRYHCLFVLLCLPIVGVIASQGKFWLLPVFVLACAACLRLWWGMNSGKASVCH
jgi:hypothetical protein